MNRIFKLNIIHKAVCAFVALSTLVACEEWQPVFTGKYENPAVYEPVELSANTTIAELKAMYAANGNKPLKIEKDIIIKGQVTTSDKDGNLYKSFYIQDETAGIEIKMGKNGLYNEYKIGQWVYIDCNGSTIGNYRGMINLGYEDPTGEYETGYYESQLFIDAHVFRGAIDEPIKPVVISDVADLKTENLGKLVTLKGLKYADKIFVLAYIDPNGDRKDYSGNAIFIDEEGGSYGVTTWAMSENKFKEYLYAGNFDSVSCGKGTVADYIERENGKVTKCEIGAMAYAVSQYFTLGTKDIQVRTSGFAKFADKPMPAKILEGEAVDMTGILTIYDTDYQFTLIDDPTDTL